MVRGTGDIKVRAARESGQPCGCDPSADHPCEGHAAFVDETETEAATGYSFDTTGEGPSKAPLIVVVTGPDRDGEIGILAADCVYLTRFEAEDLANEILRRLKGRAE
jgi:hypothetical protein